ncbi:MAG: helix-turn-helix transcriptional regulator [Cryomorphaceae bacterium]|nr:helix-turn-helix transcriptional regulator [Cryomorphaceae bacterium]
MSHFGSNIKKIRGIRGLTQQQLADKLNVTRGSVSSYEEGRAEPKIETILKAADYFQIPVEDLLKQKLTVNQLIGFKHPDVSAISNENANEFSIMTPDFASLKGDFVVLDTSKYVFHSELFSHGQILFGVKSAEIQSGVWAILLENTWYIDRVELLKNKSTFRMLNREFNTVDIKTAISIFGVYAPVQHWNLMDDLQRRIEVLEAR